MALEAQPRGSAEFAESSVLEAIVPAASNIDVESEILKDFEDTDTEGGSVLPHVSQRKILLLDELVLVYIVFKTSMLDRDVLSSYIDRLIVDLEVFAFSTAPHPDQEPKTGPPKEVIYSSTIAATNQPMIVQSAKRPDAYVYVVWKEEVFIARPQGRFHKPAVYFQPSANFKPAVKPIKTDPADEYLPSHVPTALNLLYPFENDPALAGVHPRLSATRISRYAPSTSLPREMMRPIRTGLRPLYRVLPALIWRVRYARVQTTVSDMSLIASLDLEVTTYASYDVKIKQINVVLHGGHVEILTDHQAATAFHKPGDQITYLYKITPQLALDGTPALGAQGYHLIMKIDGEVSMSKDCTPVIVVEWQTPVDFAHDQTVGLIKAAHRLSNHASLPQQSSQNPDALPSHDIQSQTGEDSAGNPIGVTLTITGPPKIYVGENFRWNVFIVNRSDKTRRLAIIVVPKRTRDHERHKSHPSASSVGGQLVEKDLLAHAVIDENIVYAKQKSSRSENANLVCLTTDIRLGQLAPNSCYTSDIDFLPLATGVLFVEAVRVIDLATNETADIRELPSIIAVERVA